MAEMEQDPTVRIEEMEPMLDLRENDAEAKLPGGVAYIQNLFPNDTDAQAANYALALVASLKNTDTAMQTGRDISIIGTPSQQLLRDVLLRLPIGVEPPDEAGDKLFEEFVKDLGPTRPEYFRDMVVDYLRFLNTYWQYFDQNTPIENKALRDNHRPMQTEMRYLSEFYLDRVLQNTQLGHEGGNLDKFEPELFRELCEPLYLRMVFQGKPTGPMRSGLSGQTIFRLMLEARSMGVPGAQETTLQ